MNYEENGSFRTKRFLLPILSVDGPSYILLVPLKKQGVCKGKDN